MRLRIPARLEVPGFVSTFKMRCASETLGSAICGPLERISRSAEDNYKAECPEQTKATNRHRARPGSGERGIEAWHKASISCADRIPKGRVSDKIHHSCLSAMSQRSLNLQGGVKNVPFGHVLIHNHSI